MDQVAAHMLSTALQSISAIPHEVEVPAGSTTRAEILSLAAIVDVAQALLAQRLAAVDAEGAAPPEYRSTTDWITHRTGMRRAGVTSLLALGRRLAASAPADRPLPSVRDALGAGQVSVDQALSIHRGTARLPLELAGPAADVLVAAATETTDPDGEVRPGLGPEELDKAARSLVRTLAPREEAELAEYAHGQRYLRLFKGTGGLVRLDGALPPHAGAILGQLLAPLVRPVDQVADPADRHLHTRQADALIELLEAVARNPVTKGHGDRPLILINADLDTVLDRTRTAHLDDGAPVDRATFERLLDDCATAWIVTDERSDVERSRGSCRAFDPGLLLTALRSIAPALGGPGLEVLAMGQENRTVTRAQRVALNHRDKGCVVRGCSCGTDRTQAHHLVPWAEGGSTDVAQMVLLCLYHHRLLSKGWQLASLGDGSYGVVAPTEDALAA